MRKLMVATDNLGKLREYAALLHGLPVRLVSPADQGLALAVEESGKTFAENAALKAVAYAQKTGLLTLADDSGLEVEALGGEPGIYSARYAGDRATDAERVRFLLHELSGTPWERRDARFVCVIAIAKPEGDVEFVEGEINGKITFAPQGNAGFGYDPIFFVPELGNTMAELATAMKNRVSHRGQAARAAREKLVAMLDTN